jgi:tetratricopeptide (TPR) repeat protein
MPGRFALHDLLRSYAAEAAGAHDSEEHRLGARHRVLDHYLHTACRADELLGRHQDRPFTLVNTQPEVTTEALANHKQALAWFESEHAVLLAALRQATGFDIHIWQLAWTLASYFEYQGHWRDWRDSQSMALDAGRRLSDKLAQALSQRSLGCALVQLSSYDDARVHLQDALHLFAELGDNTGQADAHISLAMMMERQGLYPEALPHAQAALAIAQAVGHRPRQARALNAVGWFHAQLGDHEQALVYCHQALDLAREIGDAYDEANTYDSLGYAYRHLGRQSEATACYQHAASLYGDLGDLYNEADTLVSLGDAYRGFGDFESARISWQRALAIFDQLGHPLADTVRAKIHEQSIYKNPGASLC